MRARLRPVGEGATVPLSPMDALAQRLQGAFNATAAGDFDGTVLICTQPGGAADAQALLLTVDHGTLAAGPASAGTHADVTLYFHSADEALQLLTGSANPIAAFMEGAFRSDGYLLWIFAVLAMFRAG
ncbi:MAG: SCP2 sterol-binding domain-containing protein [Pseudomonadales bacterium]